MTIQKSVFPICGSKTRSNQVFELTRFEAIHNFPVCPSLDELAYESLSGPLTQPGRVGPAGA